MVQRADIAEASIGQLIGIAEGQVGARVGTAGRAAQPVAGLEWVRGADTLVEQAQVPDTAVAQERGLGTVAGQGQAPGTVAGLGPDIVAGQAVVVPVAVEELVAVGHDKLALPAFEVCALTVAVHKPH